MNEGDGEDDEMKKTLMKVSARGWRSAVGGDTAMGCSVNVIVEADGKTNRYHRGAGISRSWTRRPLVAIEWPQKNQDTTTRLVNFVRWASSGHHYLWDRC